MPPTKCPKCQSENIYPDGPIYVCAECTAEFSPSVETEPAGAPANEKGGVTDAFGNPLKDGDAVTLIKDLKIKGAGTGVKVGTKVKNIRLVDGDDGHNISCKIDGVGAIYLKSEFVKKA